MEHPSLDPFRRDPDEEMIYEQVDFDIASFAPTASKRLDRGDEEREEKTTKEVGEGPSRTVLKTNHPCTEKGCEYNAKRSGDLVRHLSGAHNIGVKWHLCDQIGCSYKTKRISYVKSHKSLVHNVEVECYECTQKGCTFNANSPSLLKRHISGVHAAMLSDKREGVCSTRKAAAIKKNRVLTI